MLNDLAKTKMRDGVVVGAILGLPAAAIAARKMLWLRAERSGYLTRAPISSEKSFFLSRVCASNKKMMMPERTAGMRRQCTANKLARKART